MSGRNDSEKLKIDPPELTISLEAALADGMPEPRHNPYPGVDEALDAAKPPSERAEPMWLLSRLAETLEVSVDERDAGEVFHRLARASISDLPAHTRHDVPWKSAEGAWSRKSVTRREAAAMVEVALAAIRTDNRRVAVMLALGARETSLDWEKRHRLIAGLEDLARHWVGGQQPAATVVNRHGVTMPKPIGANDATIEHMMHAENDNDLEIVGGARKVTTWPFERMHNRRQIDRDPGINDLLYNAGRRYFQDHHRAGMSGIATFDPAKPMVDGGKVPGGTIPERRLEAMESFAKAREALGPRYWQVVDPIVIDERTLTDVGNVFGEDPKTARVVARERLNVGLRRLAVHYGLMRASAAAA